MLLGEYDKERGDEKEVDEPTHPRSKFIHTHKHPDTQSEGTVNKI